MAAAVGAADLGAHHAVVAVLEQLDVGCVGRFGEARPAAAGVELGVRGEQLGAAAGAAVGAVVLVVQQGAGERTLGGAMAQDLVGGGLQLGAPLLVVLGDLRHGVYGNEMLSYSHGASDTPPLGETIGANLARTAAPFPRNEARGTRHQALPLTS